MKKITCHCGEVEIEVNIADDLGKLQRCNCSICKRKGSIMAAVNLWDLKIVKGEDNLKMYQFNTNVAEHYFCSICGIYTHHKRRSNPKEFGINIGCMEGINPDEYFKLKVSNNDGHNHILDRKK
tara:strand:- start:1012 stop:1383 length:372 start_codon:yes stop_codon:yes gene_type:complete